MSTLVVAGAALAIGAALRGSLAAPASGAPEGPARGSKKGRAELTRLLQLAPLDSTQRGFFLLCAYGESRFNSTATNDTPSEAAASARAYDAKADHYAQCGFPRSAWTFGSAGWFQILIPYGLWALRKTPFACWDPRTYLYDPPKSLTAAIAFGRGLQGWSGFRINPTVANLRRGWGWPAKMGAQIEPKKREAYERHLREGKIAPASFLDEPIKRLPGNYVEIYETLAGSAA